MENPKEAEYLKQETHESNVAAKFDLETPPSSAKAADAATASTPFTAEERGFSKDIDNLATVSLDTPTASDSHSALQEHPAQLTLQDSEAAVGQSAEGLPAAAASSVPLSSSLSSLRGSEQVSEALLAAATPSTGAGPTEAPASHSQPPPELPKASPVKVGLGAVPMQCCALTASALHCPVSRLLAAECGMLWPGNTTMMSDSGTINIRHMLTCAVLCFVLSCTMLCCAMLCYAVLW